MKNILLLFFITTSIFFYSYDRVFSQDELGLEETSLEVSPVLVNLSTNSIVELESLRSEIDQVNLVYRSQLENYRRLEKDYQIALDQYQKHKTLVSIEELVKSIKRVMIARNEVLTSYFTLLRLELIEAKGIEITQKNITLLKIEQVLAELSSRRIEIDAIEERIHIDAISILDPEMGKNYQAISNEAVVLLSLGKLQSVYDKAKVIQKELIQYDSESSNITNASAKNRALTEIESVLGKTLTQLQSFWTDIQNRREKDTVGSLHTSMNRYLNPIYTNLSQTISYFNEFLTL